MESAVAEALVTASELMSMSLVAVMPGFAPTAALTVGEVAAESPPVSVTLAPGSGAARPTHHQGARRCRGQHRSAPLQTCRLPSKYVEMLPFAPAVGRMTPIPTPMPPLSDCASICASWKDSDSTVSAPTAFTVVPLPT